MMRQNVPVTSFLRFGAMSVFQEKEDQKDGFQTKQMVSKSVSSFNYVSKSLHTITIYDKISLKFDSEFKQRRMKI